ncbi:ribosomal protein S5 domain 2-type protein [Dipodascopsis tothii]|uniref:ribosomal protein S5 domain 2-type protein n=1 Tax=Dipodascopsis tothii TaxID=44089 RepID=UPI0034CECB3A
MHLSVSEESYLFTYLSSVPPTRSDGRQPSAFRPLDTTSSFLPSANGSARVRTSDGSECIVAIKADVIKIGTPKADQNIEISSSVASEFGTTGSQDEPLPSFLTTSIHSALQNSLILERLKLTSRYSYKLYIDGVILSHSAHPLSLLSMAVYLALLDTMLPKLISNADDSGDNSAEDLPQFSDDWLDSYPLCPFNERGNYYEWSPPLILLAVIVGKNVFVDSTAEEERVSQGGVLVCWTEDIISSVKTINSISNTKQRRALKVASIKNAVDLLSSVYVEVKTALEKASRV